MENKSCSCGSADNQLVVSCSGAADLGYISDQVARRMSLQNVSKMSCLALFATCSDAAIENYKTKNIKVIDGCNEDCAKKVMMQRGITNYEYFRLTDYGYVKGKTPADSQRISEVYEKIVH